MLKAIMTIVSGLIYGANVSAADGMINVASNYSVDETSDRLTAILEKKEFKIFNRVMHSDGAAKVGVELRDTQLVIFGKPAIGSQLMECQQSVAIDLPQKALIWLDNEGTVYLSYNDPNYLAKRHDLSGCEKVLEKVSGALAGIAKAATE